MLTGASDRYALLDALAGLPGKWTLSSAQLTGSGVSGEKIGIDR